MAHIQMTNLNSSDPGFMEELTNEELLAINGGGFWKRLPFPIPRPPIPRPPFPFPFPRPPFPRF